MKTSILKSLVFTAACALLFTVQSSAQTFIMNNTGHTLYVAAELGNTTTCVLIPGGGNAASIPPGGPHQIYPTTEDFVWIGYTVDQAVHPTCTGNVGGEWWTPACSGGATNTPTTSSCGTFSVFGVFGSMAFIN